MQSATSGVSNDRASSFAVSRSKVPVVENDMTGRGWGGSAMPRAYESHLTQDRTLPPGPWRHSASSQRASRENDWGSPFGTGTSFASTGTTVPENWIRLPRSFAEVIDP